MKLTIGRIVIFKQAAGRDILEFPAIVVRVNGDGSCNLQVFKGEDGCPCETGVYEGTISGSWHWPPRV